MKSKYIVLLTICSLFCVLGGACKDDDPQDSSSASSEVVYTEKDAVLSVNHSEVTIGVGESLTLVAEVENVDSPIFTWAAEGDAASDVVSVNANGNTAVLTALKVGVTKLVVSVESNGYTYFKTVDVTVVESDNVSLELYNIGFDNDGYHARLATLNTDQGDARSVDASYTAYKNNKNVAVSNFTWVSENTEIVSVTGNTFTAGREGATNVVGTYTIDGKQYTVNVSVEVYRPVIALAESFTVEVENLSAYTVTSDVLGIPQGVTYNGQTIGSFDSQSKKITFARDKMPTKASALGEGRQITVETDLASYAISVDMYTKIIRNKADFDGMSALAKKADKDVSIWDGYFVLGADIQYNGLFQSKIADLDSFYAPGGAGDNWFNGGLYGFKGVFDGKGHTIEGISIANGEHMASVFGVLHINGTVKNVSFTKASVAANSSLVCHAGGGSVENVYVQYDSIGKGTQHYEGDGSINSHCGTFFSFKEPTATANVSNCVVDITKAEINKNVSVKAVGSEYVSIKNVFVIGGTAEIQKASNATLTFSSVMDFVENANAQSRYKKFDENFWSMAGGVAVSNGIYADICGENVQFTDKPEYVVAGTAYKFSLNNNYAMITANNANVTISGGVATLAEGAANGEEIAFTATSLFDSSKKDTFTCKVSAIDLTNVVDLTAQQYTTTAFYDITEDKVYFAELGKEINADVLYFINPDYTTATYAEDGKTAVLLGVAKDKLFKFNCASVTKVLAKAEDLNYIRRDYTVSSYGNPGCYDGVITGNFVMINDIDCTGLEWKDSGTYWENSRGFGGTFDGRGYTIKNLSVGKNGLFGTLSYATIKNVNFTNVRLKANGGSGAYVALFANSIYNTVIDNVKMQFSEYVAGDGVWNTSGLMFFEKSFDSTFSNLEMDISALSGVKYLTAVLDNADIPAGSEAKSAYQNVTVIVADLEDKPAFAYKDVPVDPEDESKGTTKVAVDYPQEGFTFQVASQ